MKRIEVLICDDQNRFIEDFRNNHKNHYDIREISDIRELIDRLNEKKPDVVLLDLYHPKDCNSNFEERRLNAEEELKKLDKQIISTKKAVDLVWEPIGLDILKDIRKNSQTTDLPVLIYSQRGLVLLGDDQLQEVEKLKGHWMLKKVYSPNTEKIRIDRVIAENKKPIILTYRISFSILFVLLTLTSLLLLKFDKTFELIAGSLFSGIASIFISKQIEKIMR